MKNKKDIEYIKVLREKHSYLDSEIKKLELINANRMVIIDLKKKKLKLKDEIKKYKI
jgi:hypothetical protein